MNPEENKRTVRRLFEEIITKGDYDVADEIFAEGFVWPQFGLKGPDGARTWVKAFRTAFPDVDDRVEEQIAEGDVVITRVTVRGTHTGPWYGLAPTGRTAEFPAIGIDRLRDGRIVERTAMFDLAGAMRQLGCTTIPAATSPIGDA
jgi:steroid delta-isomerase-like uncharacterized protein